MLGRVAYNTGDYREAKARATEALQINEEIGSRNDKAKSLLLLGNIAQTEGKTKPALELSSISLIIFSILGSDWTEKAQTQVDQFSNESGYTAEKNEQLIEMAKAEYEKDEGRAVIRELLENW